MASASRIVFLGSDKSPSLLFQECAVPKVEEGQILGKILCATICGSDLHTIQGRRKEATPSVLGHEAVVEVVQCKRRGCNLKPGDRITFSVVDSCCRCSRCTEHLPQKCLSGTKYGHRQLAGNSVASYSGCYASHIVLTEGTFVYKIPDNVSDRLASPVNCALATMVNALSSVPGNPGNGVALIQGAGLLGIYGCALLTERGFSKIYITDPNRDRLLIASKFGGTPVNTELPNAERGPPENSIDLVVEVCGDSEPVDEGVQCLAPGGTYIFVGAVHPHSRLNITIEKLIRKCLTLKGIHNYGPKHLEEAVNFLAKTVHKYPYDTLFSPDYPIKDFQTAFQVAQSQRYLRAVVVPGKV